MSSHTITGSLIHRVTERERLEILATYYGPSFELDFPKAREQIQQLTVLYPNDADPFVMLGHLSMFAGETSAALEANARAVALSPECDTLCSYNSGYALALAGKPAEAMVFLRRAQSLRPGYVGVDMSVASTLWMSGDLDSSGALLSRSLVTAEMQQRNQIRVVLSSLDYFTGHLSSSRKLCLDGVRECRALGIPGDEAYFHYLLGEIAAVEGKTKEFRAQMENATALSISPCYDLALVGMSYGREGMRLDAERILARLQSVTIRDPWFLKYRPAFLDLIQGEIMMSEGEYEKARRHFEAVAKVRAGDPYYQLAQLGIANCAGRASDRTAVGLFESILSARGEVMMASLSSVRRTGLWTRWLWPDTEFELGRVFASRHQVPQAVAHINAALGYWNTAEASDHRAARARALLMQLTKGG
jgi:tetratricopeptide (TPR) repeat protein